MFFLIKLSIAQAKNNRILTELKSLNAKSLLELTTSNQESLISTQIDNSIKINRYPLGKVSH